MRVCIRSFWTHQQCWSSSKVWAMLPISNLKKCIFEPGLKPRSRSRVRLPRPRGPKIWLKISRKSSSYVSRKSLALSQISNRNRRFFFSNLLTSIKRWPDRLCAKLEPKSLRSSGGTLAGQCSLVRTASLKSAFSFLVLIHAMWASVKDFNSAYWQCLNGRTALCFCRLSANVCQAWNNVSQQHLYLSLPSHISAKGLSH